jgi:23S rRNA pseudouridine2605 synthase
MEQDDTPETAGTDSGAPAPKRARKAAARPATEAEAAPKKPRAPRKAAAEAAPPEPGAEDAPKKPRASRKAPAEAAPVEATAEAAAQKPRAPRKAAAAPEEAPAVEEVPAPKARKSRKATEPEAAPAEASASGDAPAETPPKARKAKKVAEPAAQEPAEPAPLPPREGERIAKVLSRAGVSSRRDAERLILERRVTMNGRVVDSPATNVVPGDRLTVDGIEVGQPEATRLWLYHKPAGLVTTESDEEGRETVFESLPDDMPRVMSIGRLDITSEGCCF